MKYQRVWTLLLTLALLLCTVGCSEQAPSGDNARWDGERKDGQEYVASGERLPRKPIFYEYDVTSDPFAAAQMALAIDLLQGTVARNDYDATTLISPLSVSMALAMMANGAEGQTREQMLDVVARDITQEQLNEGMKQLRLRMLGRTGLVREDLRRLPTVHLANSIWLRESDAVTFRDEFLQINEDCYAADAYARPFDADTVNEINDWVDEQTDGMIPSVLDGLDAQDMMVLINTLLFKGNWEDPFTERQITDGTFTAANGQVREAKMLHGTEYYCLDDGAAQGFMKYYEGYDYAFVALLPDVGTTVADYVAGMRWENMLSMLKNKEAGQGIWCRYQLPKFSISYQDGGRMDEVLRELGMTDAYSPENADFSAVGSMASGHDNIYLGRVIHKTAMTLDENGTSAAAVTAMVEPGSPRPIEIRELVFDRPFVCMIVEADTGIPLFMGTVMDIE